ncbi:hypothetical protein [Sphingomonas phyllosphaerae]|uniref:hypothetical protein n=1 Tax=Sphingomonas phyllosphaerae TaxID=257003 RepID=UPI0004108E70|nr:hypothetical protein [Sphingomonas phyllosphaerae]
MMTASDLLWLVGFPAATAAVLAGVLLVRLGRGWSRRRVILTASMPLPLLGALLCVGVFVSALLASPERCGVDACGMAMMFATFGLAYAAGAFLLGAAAATGIVYSLGRR